jgi:hypothetical protein
VDKEQEEAEQYLVDISAIELGLPRRSRVGWKADVFRVHLDETQSRSCIRPSLYLTPYPFNAIPVTSLCGIATYSVVRIFFEPPGQRAHSTWHLERNHERPQWLRRLWRQRR